MDTHEGMIMSGASRQRRPGSSASSQSRFTPQSSNGSSANLTYRSQLSRSDRETIQENERSGQDLGQSSLLQERLREKKAARLNERRKSIDVETGADNRAGVQSSPVRNGLHGRDQDRTRPSSSGRIQGDKASGKKTMGIKEMEEVLSTLHKQNFDLKLELFHRRQRQLALEERLDAAEADIASQSELQAVNEQLLSELVKRDQALEEAVGIICGLEEKVERLMEERMAVRSFDGQYEPSYLRNNHSEVDSVSQDPGSSPPQIVAKPTTIKSDISHLKLKPMSRMPSFMSEQSQGADALRSLYLPNASNNQSILSLPKLAEDNESRVDGEGMDSPRMSVLSESSFISVYGEKTLAFEALDIEVGSRTPGGLRHRQTSSVEKWINERSQPAVTTPSKQTTPKAVDSKPAPTQYMSINGVLESPLQRFEKVHRQLTKQADELASVRLQYDSESGDRNRIMRRNEKERKPDTLRRTDVELFDDQNGLPPTPDTFSTSTLRNNKNSTDTIGQDASESRQAFGRPHFDRALSVPAYNKSWRPRSAVETITKSNVIDDISDVDIDIETDSTNVPWIAAGSEHSSRTPIQPPDLFTFSNNDDWGRDIMFNRDRGLPQPSRTTFSPARDLGRDNTVRSSTRPEKESFVYTRDDPYLFQATPLDISPRPSPPERRSSIASPASKGTTLKKGRRESMVTTNAAPSNRDPFSKPEEKESKRSSITSKIFGIGRSNSNSNSASPRGYIGRSQGYDFNRDQNGRANVDLSPENLHDSSATPPPISRNPRGVKSPPLTLPVRGENKRPTTAGSLESKLPISVPRNWNSRAERRQSLAGHDSGVNLQNEGALDGAGDERDNGKNGKSQGRKWFKSLSRNNSVRQ